MRGGKGREWEEGVGGGWFTMHNFLYTSQGLQNFMYSMLKGSSIIAGKMSLEVMVKLHKKNIW